MTLSRDAMLEVMAYVDGELDGEALDHVESLLASDEDAARLAIELRTLGDCVRIVEADRAMGKSADEVADDVMRKLDAQVVSLAPLAVRRRNAIVTGAITTAFAMAAGWWLLIRTPAVESEAPVAKVTVTPSATPTERANPLPQVGMPEQVGEQVAVQANAPNGGVDVESVESPSHEVSVFYVPATAGANSNASSVVVWIGEGEATK